MKKLLLLLLLPHSVFLFSQDPGKGSKNFESTTVYEKVYLHVDREMYVPGEDVWFRIYLLSGLNNKYLKGYKNVYVQLIDDVGQVVYSRLILAYNGAANGDIQLGKYLREGQYTLRAHTLYQQNFGEESSCLKKIWISGLKKQDDKEEDMADSKNIDFAMYPESGNLLMNAPNFIAFKATAEDGYGVEVSGFVIDNTGDTISPVSTSWLGMGKFTLMPVEGRTYVVVLDQVPGKKFEIKDIQQDGIALQYRDDVSQLRFALVCPLTHPFNGPAADSTYILKAVHKGITLISDTLTIQNFYSEFSYPKSDFPLGITVFSLQDIKGQTIAERLVFVQTGMSDRLTIFTDSGSYQCRSKVQVQVDAELEEGDSIMNGMSLAVVNRDYLVRNGYSNDIRSYLLLDSELKGYIESPASYFIDDEGPSSKEKLDLLMMVQGWRTYYWPDIIEAEPENLLGWNDVGISIKGHLNKLFGGKPIQDFRVELGPFSASFHFELSYTDSAGIFRFNRLYLKDSAVVMIKSDMAFRNRFAEISVDSFYIPERLIDQAIIDTIIIPPIVPSSFYSENYSRLEAEKRYAIEAGIIWLEEVEVVMDVPKAFAFMTSKEAESVYGMADYSFQVTDDDMTYTDIFDFLESRVPGVLVEGHSVTIRGGLKPVFMIDGIINDLMDPSHIPMGDIASIDIIKNGAGTAALGSRGADGVIAIYTKTGEVGSFERSVPSRIDKRFNGFNSPRSYYSQKYTPESRMSEIPDFRPTLHWEPYLYLEDESATVGFFTSDYRSEYLILVEGISKKGRIYTGTGSFHVN